MTAVNDIVVGTRHRKELGDIAALAASMNAVGLLHPIVLTGDGQLIAGARRLEAAKRLGWVEVPTVVATSVTDALTFLQAERDENTCRVAFLPSEAVALGRAIEAIERPKAEEARREHGRTAPGRPKNTSGKLPEVSPSPLPPASRETRTKAAAAVGIGTRTYEKAKKVVEASEAQTLPAAVVDTAKKAAEEMDRTGKVDAAYKKVEKAKAVAAAAPERAKAARNAEDMEKVAEYVERTDPDLMARMEHSEASKVLGATWRTLQRLDAEKASRGAALKEPPLIDAFALVADWLADYHGRRRGRLSALPGGKSK